MMNQAVGFKCEGCGRAGPHNIQNWLYDGGYVAGLVLSCHGCESVFEVSWKVGDREDG